MEDGMSETEPAAAAVTPPPCIVAAVRAQRRKERAKAAFTDKGERTLDEVLAEFSAADAACTDADRAVRKWVAGLMAAVPVDEPTL
jgi:urocanate hydratase